MYTTRLLYRLTDAHPKSDSKPPLFAPLPPFETWAGLAFGQLDRPALAALLSLDNIGGVGTRFFLFFGDCD